MRDFLAITGPTTSGKTQLSIAVAEALDGEIICMDSRQVYRGMDIVQVPARPWSTQSERPRYSGVSGGMFAFETAADNR